MSEGNVDKSFFDIVSNFEFHEVLGLREYEDITPRVETLQLYLEQLSREIGPFEHLDEESKLHAIFYLQRRIGYEAANPGQLSLDDEIIGNGNCFVICADKDPTLSCVEVIGSPLRVHGRIKSLGVMEVPEFVDNDGFFDPDSSVETVLSVVASLDPSTATLECPEDTTANQSLTFHELDHDQVLLPLVYIKDGLRIKRRVPQDY